MKDRKKIFCELDIVRFLPKDKFEESVGKEGALSVSHGTKTEIMIFFGKEEKGENYEVRVYKAKPENKYVPHACDACVGYEENDEYASFFFDDYYDGRSFIEFLFQLHEEYRERPVRRIGE